MLHICIYIYMYIHAVMYVYDACPAGSGEDNLQRAAWDTTAQAEASYYPKAIRPFLEIAGVLFVGVL